MVSGGRGTSPDTTDAADGPDTDGDGIIDEVEEVLGTDPRARSTACAQSSYVSVVPDGEVPVVDFVVTVDTSGSMAEELPLIRAGLVSTFSELFERPDEIDARLILVAQYGAAEFALCLPAPLTDDPCDGSRTRAPRGPKGTHVDANVDSRNTLDVLTGSARVGWSTDVREGATVVFIAISDDDSSVGASEFERALQLGVPQVFLDGARRYVFHSVVGVDAPDALAVKPESGLIAQRCGTAANEGLEYQRLSRATGGLRFSVCGAVDYDAIFDAVALEAATQVAIPCSLPLPLAPEAERRLDLRRMTLQLEPPGEDPRALVRAFDTSECGASGYTLDPGQGGGRERIDLCPELCEDLRVTDGAILRVLSSCLARECTGSLTSIDCQNDN